MHQRGITRYRVLVRLRTQTRLSCMSGIRPPAQYHGLHQLQPMLSEHVPTMMQHLLQQWGACVVEQCKMEQCTKQWNMQYGCQPMQLYQMPTYAYPPHDQDWEPIAGPELEWTGATDMPPGVGHERDDASQLSPHKDPNDGCANDGMCSTVANNAQQGGTFSSLKGKEMEETTAVLQTVADKDMGLEPFSNIILMLPPLTSPISQAA